MTVKELLRPFRDLEIISFIGDYIEEINTNDHYSFRDVKRHFDELVIRVYVVGKDEIIIESREIFEVK